MTRRGFALARSVAAKAAIPALIMIAWSATAVILGVIVGLASVVLPPMGALGIVAAVASLLLWAIPDLPVFPRRLIWKMYLVMLVVDLALPIYYAIDIASLPWISARRIASGLAVIVFLFALAASSAVRREVVSRLGASRPIAICAIGFLVIIFFSIFTSANPLSGISGMTETILEWYLPFLLAVYAVQTYSNVITVIKVICGLSLWVALTGILEFRFQHKFVLDIFPPSMLAQFIAQNPYFANITEPWFRNGMYRAAATFVTSNSFGEFAAVVFPLGLYFVVHGETRVERIFGIVVAIAMFASVVVSGARVGYIGMLVATPAFAILWTIREQRFRKGEIGPAFVSLLLSAGLSAVFFAVFFWHRARVYVFGDGRAAFSTQSRLDQWASGWPHILSNPITGHGMGSSGTLIGWGFDGMVSVDSFPLALLVDFGAPGFLFFSGLVILPIWYGVRAYISDDTRLGALRGAIACSFLAYAFSRLFLAQRENLTLIFTLVAITIALNYLAKEEDARQDNPAEEAPPVRPASRVAGRPRAIGLAPTMRRSRL